MKYSMTMYQDGPLMENSSIFSNGPWREGLGALAIGIVWLLIWISKEVYKLWKDRHEVRVQDTQVSRRDSLSEAWLAYDRRGNELSALQQRYDAELKQSADLRDASYNIQQKLVLQLEKLKVEYEYMKLENERLLNKGSKTQQVGEQ